MQRHDEDGPSQPPQPRNHLPHLAPRKEAESSSSSRRTSSTLPAGRTPRLSHRSRAGCYTCRGRKVKCDEIQPKCGPCARLHKECDWEVRWNFSDATSSTQNKHSNVSTSGSAVWDPNTRVESPTPSTGFDTSYDDLPAFATLTNDEDRERKAETTLPGTYSVVVTPKSFADLPEYASTANAQTARRQTSDRPRASTVSSTGSSKKSRSDPNVVVLDRFEESSPSMSLQLPGRQSSLPETMQHMSLSITPSSTTSSQPDTPITHMAAAESRLISHFRQYIVARLVPEDINPVGSNLTPGSMRDIFEVEAAKFQPLHNAMCALSALNLSYRGQSTLEEAIEHYDRALSAHTPTSNELLSDGVFLRHYLLFIYDISMTVDASNAGAGMWVDHLKHLARLTQNRHAHFGQEPHGFIMWAICSFDTYACLMGNGSGDYFRTVLEHQLLPPLGSGMPTAAQHSPTWRNESQAFPVIMNLIRGVLIHTAKIARAAQQFRSEASERASISPGRCAQWQARVSQLQSDLSNFWAQAYPDFLGNESALAGQNLDSGLRYVFEHAFLLYQATTIYSRTSMFPSQRLIPIANQAAFAADTATRISHILTLASTILSNGDVERRETVFPVFIAGFATMNGDAKVRAIELLKAFEGHGIGQNTSVVRRLLVGVCEEQRRRVDLGGRMEEVDWLRYGKERGLSVVNCGL